MSRTTLLAALTAALMIPSAHAQNTPSTSPGGQAGAGNRGQIGGQVGTEIRNQTGTEKQAGNRNQPGTTRRDDASTSRNTAVSDQLFAMAAAAAGKAEVSMSELGARRATDPDLKQFSQRMIDEHTKANQELKTLASEKNISLPDALDARAAFCVESLAGLSGDEFDRCYSKAQFLAHMDAAALFEAEAQRGTDPQVKAYASKTLSHIKEHLNTIKPIAMKYNKDMMDHQPDAHRSGDGHDDRQGDTGRDSSKRDNSEPGRSNKPGTTNPVRTNPGGNNPGDSPR